MPKRTDLDSILIIGAGPIVIGQACEFDYSGTQACKALKEEGYRVILVNSNPATIMTDPEFADVHLHRAADGRVSGEDHRGGAALRAAADPRRPDRPQPLDGAAPGRASCQKYGVEMIGAKPEAIRKGEDRELFKQAMITDRPRRAEVEDGRIRSRRPAGPPTTSAASRSSSGPPSRWAARAAASPTTARSSTGSSANGLEISPVHEVLVEECLLGWKEFEMEVMRDHKDQCVVICSIENFDPMGVHTGDSITVAPALTLTDKEYQLMRDASFAVIREIGVETGGSNIQFAVNPETGRMVVIEMNPRVSRSSALASKATGFPIAKIAAKLAVGYTLDELRNDITRVTPASFEPTIDYVVTKVPRFTFEKFPDADPTLTSSMKSVGEAMAIGRTFKESIQKALRSLEIGARGFGGGGKYGGDERPDDKVIKQKLGTPNAERIFYIRHAFRAGYTVGADPRPDEDRPVVPAPAARAPRDGGGAEAAYARHDRRRPAAPGQGGRLLRRAARAPARRPTSAPCAPTARRPASTPSTAWSTPARPSSRPSRPTTIPPTATRTRSSPRAAAEDHDPRRRPEPHRPGHRVRLLLRARLASPCARSASRP